MNDNELRTLVSAMQSDPRVLKAIERLDGGYGTYKDVNDIALRLGARIADELSISFDAESLRRYLEAGHSIIATVAETAQTNLNNAAGIGVKPMVTKTPNYKIDQTVTSIASVDPEAIPAMCANVIPTFVLEMVDDIEKYNLDFQQKSGMHPIIKRTWSGSYPSHDTKHTDWCRELAGEWEYGSEPRRVYARHEGCKCTVEYFPNKKAQGRITALSKGQIDVDSVLWNTRTETLSARLRKAGKK